MPTLKNYEFLEYSPKTSFKNIENHQKPIKKNVVVTWDGEEMSSEIFDSNTKGVPIFKTNIHKPVPRTARRNRRKMSEN